MKVLGGLLVETVLVILLAIPIYAADISVGDECSLTDAIEAANRDKDVSGCPSGDGADVIWLTGDVRQRTELPQVRTEITIEGRGHSLFGSGYHSFFDVDSRGNLTINHLTLTGGADQGGGAIFNRGILIVNNSEFSNNSAYLHGGGAISNSGSLLIVGSVFAGNSAASYSGAIHNLGELVIKDSIFHANSVEFADYEGSVANAGAIYNDGELNIHSSTFSDNSAAGVGGAIVSGGELSISATTIVRNSALHGGGLYVYGFDSYASDSTLSHVTLARNAARLGGGIYVDSMPNAIVNVRNSIIAQNTGGDCFGGLNQDTGNLLLDGSCYSPHGHSPAFGALTESEDGLPGYLPLMAGSPAIDAAHPAYCEGTDQIGTPRPQGAACDIGAIEFVSER